VNVTCTYGELLEHIFGKRGVGLEIKSEWNVFEGEKNLTPVPGKTIRWEDWICKLEFQTSLTIENFIFSLSNEWQKIKPNMTQTKWYTAFAQNESSTNLLWVCAFACVCVCVSVCVLACVCVCVHVIFLGLE
jgi:hypothetical protein